MVLIILVEICLLPVVLSVGIKSGYNLAFEKEKNFSSKTPVNHKIYKETSWLKLTELDGGYEVWEDGQSTGLAITKDKKRLILILDNHNKQLLDNRMGTNFKLGEGLHVDVDNEEGVKIIINNHQKQ